MAQWLFQIHIFEKTSHVVCECKIRFKQMETDAIEN